MKKNITVKLTINCGLCWRLLDAGESVRMTIRGILLTDGSIGTMPGTQKIKEYVCQACDRKEIEERS